MQLRANVAVMTAAVIACVVLASARAGAQCPAFGYDKTCGTIITITTGLGAVITKTGQGPYDGNDDTLVGVVNNSSVPITSLVLSSSTDIMGFDGDGINSYGAPGNASDTTGYGGPNSYFTNINANRTLGTVNFVTPLAPHGGTTYFSLEEDLTSTAPCSSIIKGGVATPTVSGARISSSFTPNFGYSLAQAAVLCGFVDFDWVQTIVRLPDPNPFSAYNQAVAATTGVVNGSTIPIRLGGAYNPKTAGTPFKLKGSSAPFNDPVQGGGYTYNSAAPDYSYPFYCNVLGDSVCPKTPAVNPTKLAIADTPGNPCLVDSSGNPSPGYNVSATVRASCGNSTAPVGAYTAFTTHLAGVKTDGTAKDLGLGYSWKSTFNGSAGGVSTLKNGSAADANSGTGGVSLVSLTQDTNYQFSGFGVVSVNGSATGQTLLRGDQVLVIASGLAYSRVTRTFSGTFTLMNLTDNPIAGPLQLVFSFLDPTITIPNASGTFGGFPFITVPSDLAAGQSKIVNVQFSNPSNLSIDVSPVVYAGSFN